MNQFGYYLISFCLILSIRDIFVHAHVEEEHDADEFKKEFGDEIPADEGYSKGTEEDHIELREPSSFSKPKPLTIKDLPNMKFVFCVSCGYRNAFEQFSHVVRERYPDMPIEGSNYPPAPWKAFLAQAINVLKMVAIGIIVSGANPFASLGMGYPSILAYGHQNKLSMCMMIFLLSNMIEGSLISTGAFEIYLGEHQLWSKLDSGRVPSPQELIQLVDSQLELMGKIPAGSGTGFGEFQQQQPSP